LRQTSSVLYLAIDDLLLSRTVTDPGLEDFFGKLSLAGVPCVWLTSKTRLQIDEPRRKMGIRDPFIAEDGCGVFLPEDYFHLRPQANRTGAGKGGKTQDVATIRLGRFTCLPIAKQQPAAAEALEALAAQTGVSVVPLASLPPRQLAQNTGLHPREAELARQRDFDELFFFAGASAAQIEGFRAAAQSLGMQLRPQGALWSLAIGASAATCIRELAKLYDRALHAHARTLGVAYADQPPAFLASCDRGVLLTANNPEDSAPQNSESSRERVLRVPFNTPDRWERLTNILHR
jgi:mannosyl-3-phosphoglycerate phosphatase